MNHALKLIAIETKIFRALDQRSVQAHELKRMTRLRWSEIHAGLRSLKQEGMVDGSGVRQLYSLTESGRVHFERFVGPESPPRAASEFRQTELF